MLAILKICIFIYSLYQRVVKKPGTLFWVLNKYAADGDRFQNTYLVLFHMQKITQLLFHDEKYRGAFYKTRFHIFRQSKLFLGNFPRHIDWQNGSCFLRRYPASRIRGWKGITTHRELYPNSQLRGQNQFEEKRQK